MDLEDFFHRTKELVYEVLDRYVPTKRDRFAMAALSTTDASQLEYARAAEAYRLANCMMEQSKEWE